MYDHLIQEYEGQFGKGRTVDDIVEWIEELPPMPNVITRALRQIDDVNTTPQELAEILMLDPALASAILRLANSAGIGQQQRVTTLDVAILLLGMGVIKRLLLASALRRWNTDFGPMQRLLWEKSLGAATAAHVLCQQQKKWYRDELCLSGLLHNLGQIVLLSDREIGASYPSVLDRMRQHNEDFITAEREIIGFSHPLIGALVAQKWGLPLPTCQAILHYADPFEGNFSPQDEESGMLKLAVGLGLAAGFGQAAGQFPEMKDLETLATAVGFNRSTIATDLQELMDNIKTRFKAEVSAYD
jgi:HD-like signal output (HDOD) protein